jgi:hypothetical protein
LPYFLNFSQMTLVSTCHAPRKKFPAAHCTRSKSGNACRESYVASGPCLACICAKVAMDCAFLIEEVQLQRVTERRSCYVIKAQAITANCPNECSVDPTSSHRKADSSVQTDHGYSLPCWCLCYGLR